MKFLKAIARSAQEFADKRGAFGDQGKQHLGRPCRTVAAAFPIQQSPLGYADTARKRCSRESCRCPDRGDIDALNST